MSNKLVMSLMFLFSLGMLGIASSANERASVSVKFDAQQSGVTPSTIEDSDGYFAEVFVEGLGQMIWGGEDQNDKYANENGPVHGWICQKALETLPENGGLRKELKEYFPPTWSDLIPPEWNRDPDTPFNKNTAVIEGAWEEDFGYRPSAHFWDGRIGYNGTFSSIPWSLDRRSAIAKAQEMFKNSIIQYKIDKIIGYYLLGRTAHLLQDMSIPAHTLLDPHVSNYLGGVDSYEEYTAKEYKKIGKSPENSIPKLNLSLGSFNFTDSPASSNIYLTSLFARLASLSQKYDSNNRNGTERQGRDNTLHSTTAGSTPMAMGIISQETLIEYQSILQKAATEYTASLYKLFWWETHKKTKIISPAEYGIVPTSGTTLKWDHDAKDMIIHYKLYLGYESDSNPKFIINTKETSYDTGVLQEGRFYYWRVVAVNEGGDFDLSNKSSPIWSFRAVTSTTTKPVITAVNNNNSISTSNERQWVNITGTNFKKGFAATMWDPSGNTWSIGADRLEWVNSTTLNIKAGLTVSGTWKIMISNPDGMDSEKFDFSVVNQGTVATPIISPNGGYYSVPVKVTITCSTANAQIRYTLDTTEPTAASTLYTGSPITLNNLPTQIKAKGFRANFKSSGTASVVYLNANFSTLSVPVFSPDPSMTYSGLVSVSMSAAPNTAIIRFTMDGSEPTQYNGWTYKGTPFSISSNTTFKAKAFNSNYTYSSNAAIATYTIANGAVATPRFSPSPGKYESGQRVTINCDTPGAYIKYSLSGEPTETYGSDYYNPIYVGDTTTIRAKAFRNGWTPSATAVGTWTIAPPPPSTLVVEPSTITATVSKRNSYATVSFRMRNTGNKSITAVASTSSVPWATWSSFQKTIEANQHLDSEIHFNTYGLTPGIYRTTLFAQQSGYFAQEIPIILLIEDYPSLMEISINSLIKKCVERTSPPMDVFHISNNGGGTVNYNIETTEPWLSVDPTHGSVSSDSNAVNIIYNTQGLAAGRHEGNIKIAGNLTQNKEVHVIIDVTEYHEGAPVIKNITPLKGSVIGGNKIYISGANLLETSEVIFGDIISQSIEVLNDSLVIATTPKSNLMGECIIKVNNSTGSASYYKSFKYVAERSISMENVSNIGGSCVTLAKKGRHIFASEGMDLVVFDVNTFGSMQKIGKLSMPSGIEDIVINNNYAYLAIGDMGLSIIDISDPINPIQCGYHSLESAANKICFFDQYICITTSNNIYIINISDPAKPKKESSLPINGFPWDLKITNNGKPYAYASIGNKFNIYDLSNINSIKLINSYQISSASIFYRIAINNNYAYLNELSLGTLVLDISNPYSITPINNLPVITGGDMHIENNILHIFTRGGSYDIININNFNNPVKIGSIDSVRLGSPGKIIKDGNLIYISGREFLTEINISNINKPIVQSQYIFKAANCEQLSNYKNNIYISNAYGFQIIDCSDLSKIMYRGSPQGTRSEQSLLSLIADNNTLYGSSGKKLYSFNVADSGNPYLMNSFGDNNSYGYSLIVDDKNHLYSLALSTQGSSRFELQIYDLSSTPPSLISKFVFPENQFISSFCLNNNYLFFSCSSDCGIIVMDARNLHNTSINKLMPTSVNIVDVVSVNNYVYAISESGDVLTYDISDINKIIELPFISLNKQVRSKASACNNDFLFVPGKSNGYNRLDIIDISNPYSIKAVADYVCPSHVWDLVADDKYIYMIGNSGLDIVKFRDNINPNVSLLNHDVSLGAQVYENTVSIYGLANDNELIQGLYWSNDRGGSGVALGTTEWSIPEINLELGTNIITVTAYDAAGNTSSEILTVNYMLPDVTSPKPLAAFCNDPVLNNYSTVSYTVIFSEPVVGVVPEDFILETTGTLSNVYIHSVSGEGTTRLVTIDTGTGDGSIWFSVRPSGSGITDIQGNLIEGGIESSSAYTIDRTAPELSYCRVVSEDNPTSGDFVAFKVQFNEEVLDVTVNDFVPVGTGIDGCVVTGISMDADIYTVNVKTGSGDGALGLMVGGNDPIIIDRAGNRMTGSFAPEEYYVVDKTPPGLELLGENPHNLEAGTPLIDMGAEAFDNVDGDITREVLVLGLPIDVSRIGTNLVSYLVQDRAGNTSQLTRVVNVEDTTGPLITLLGEETVTVEALTAYEDAGANALDVVDGDVTWKIRVQSNVNTLALGDYTVTFDVTDSMGNDASQIVRTVQVRDTTPPTITLRGDEVVTIPRGVPYVEMGADAVDAYDGELTNNLVSHGTVDTEIVGDYEVTYSVSDSSGNEAAAVTRRVVVRSNTVPVVTLLGPETHTVECGGIYAEHGAVAGDAEDGDLTGSVQISGSVVNTLVPGTYGLAYTVTDSDGNGAPAVMRTVVVSDSVSPVVQLLGEQSTSVIMGMSYVDAGATVSDLCDGDITWALRTTGLMEINTGLPGVYIINYDATDRSGNSAVTVSRSVVVTESFKPVVSIIGSASMTLECGDVYEEPGATAIDFEDGDITDHISITGMVDATVPGTYQIAYSVHDNDHNAAETAYRTVVVQDTEGPSLVLNGGTLIELPLGQEFLDPGVAAMDVCEGDVTGSVTVQGLVDTLVPGIYTLTYSARDSDGRQSLPLTRTVFVFPDNLPVIALNGPATAFIECGESYADPGATAQDPEDGDITSLISITGTVETGVPGQYQLSYDVVDSAGNNSATATRLIIVEDTKAPTINLLGGHEVSLAMGGAYIDPGYSAHDACDGDLTSAVVVRGTVDASVAGTYTIVYSVKDGGGRSAPDVTRRVAVTRGNAPVITLLGPATVELECGASYTELGFTAFDAEDGDLTVGVAVTGIVNILVPGIYEKVYTLVDSHQNVAVSQFRQILVKDTSGPVITLTGGPAISIECGETYFDPGATAMDACAGDVTHTLTMEGIVNTSKPGIFTIEYCAYDPANNPAERIARTVTVTMGGGCLPDLSYEEAMSALAGGFDLADTNNDNLLTFHEASIFLTRLTQVLFDQIDTDRNGLLSRAEVGLGEDVGCGCNCAKSDTSVEGMKKRLGDMFLGGLMLGLLALWGLRRR